MEAKRKNKINQEIFFPLIMFYNLLFLNAATVPRKRKPLAHWKADAKKPYQFTKPNTSRSISKRTRIGF